MKQPWNTTDTLFLILGACSLFMLVEAHIAWESHRLFKVFILFVVTICVLLIIRKQHHERKRAPDSKP